MMDLIARHDAVRYVAVAGKNEAGMDNLVIRERPGLDDASSDESDRYEELLVNPTLLTLATRRGDIDCGGLRYLIIGYGNFHQIVVPTADGHVSVSISKEVSPYDLVPDVMAFAGQYQG